MTLKGQNQVPVLWKFPYDRGVHSKRFDCIRNIERHVLSSPVRLSHKQGS